MKIQRRALTAVLFLLSTRYAMTSEPYQRESRMRHRGIGREASAELSPRALVASFGEPSDESWDNESLGGFYFVSSDDRPFTVYFRAYDQSPPKIRQLRASFWREESAYEFSIGALSSSGVKEFVTWLHSRVAK
jgi:hypothetical protein